MTILNHSLINEWAHYDHNIYMNCWGASMLYLGVLKHPQWLNEKEMRKLLKENVYETLELKVNDIYAIYNIEGALAHTAIYLGNGEFWHKAGNSRTEVTTKNKIDTMYMIPDHGAGFLTKFYRQKTKAQYDIFGRHLR